MALQTLCWACGHQGPRDSKSNASDSNLVSILAFASPILWSVPRSFAKKKNGQNSELENSAALAWFISVSEGETPHTKQTGAYLVRAGR
jgi:hypothetical protein